VVTLKTLPPPDQLDSKVGNENVLLLSCVGDDTSYKLFKKLQIMGWNPVVVIHPADEGTINEIWSEDNKQILRLESGDDKAIEALLTKISNEYGSIGAFIHLHPDCRKSNREILFDPGSQEVIKTVFLMAKHLKKILGNVKDTSRAIFMTVARLDGQFGMKAGSEFDPLGGGLSGLVKTLNQEWQGVFCRSLDISPSINSDEAAQLIVAEMMDPNRLITEAGYGDLGRVTLVVEG